MNKFLLIVFVTLMFVGAVNAFSNSLDGTGPSQPVKSNNNFLQQNSATYTNVPNTPYNPKEHKGFEHNDAKYTNSQMNDTRYNSNCQFGQCIPGGINPNNK